MVSFAIGRILEPWLRDSLEVKLLNGAGWSGVCGGGLRKWPHVARDKKVPLSLGVNGTDSVSASSVEEDSEQKAQRKVNEWKNGRVDLGSKRGWSVDASQGTVSPRLSLTCGWEVGSWPVSPKMAGQSEIVPWND